jgi:hypothetical protein
MSGPAPTEPYEPLLRRLPERLRPRGEEHLGRGRLRRLETIVLILVGLFLATAMIADVARQTGVNKRLTADLQTWRAYTHHDYKNVSADQHLLGTTTKREVVCGNTTPGPPKQRTQICLVMTGPVHAGRRTVSGSWYLPANTEDNVRSRRYGCFGSVTIGLCPR